MKRSFLLSAALLSSLAAAQVVYCTPSSASFNCVPTGGDEFISNVTVSNLNNNSVCGAPPGYEDYTNSVAPVLLLSGQTYAISVSISRAWNTDRVYVMLDANGDGTFQTGVGGNELLASYGPLAGIGSNGNTTVIVGGNITIPATLIPSSRLRVRMSYGALAAGNEACANNSYGNCEDYTATLNAVAPPAEYQVNQPGASHDIDGVQGLAFVPAGVVTRCINNNFNVNMMSPWGGLPFDVLVGDATLIPRSGGGYVSPSGTQVVNINLATMSFAFGGFITPFPGSFTFTASLPVPAAVATQMVIVDPTNIDTVSVSQPCRLQIVAPAGIAGFNPPIGDDIAIPMPTPVCIPFYGSIHSNAWVSTNGRVGFGTTPDASFFPTTAAGMTGDPFVGYWCDLNVVTNSSITATNPGSGLTRLQWNAVPYYGTSIFNTFAIQFDANTQTVWLDMLPTILPNGAGNAFLGLTKGLGATDPGPVAYEIGGIASSGSGVVGPGMIYSYQLMGTGITNLNGVLFFWNSGTQNYDWTGL